MMTLSDKEMWALVGVELVIGSPLLQMRLIRRLINVLNREGANG